MTVHLTIYRDDGPVEVCIDSDGDGEADDFGHGQYPDCPGWFSPNCYGTTMMGSRIDLTDEEMEEAEQAAQKQKYERDDPYL